MKLLAAKTKINAFFLAAIAACALVGIDFMGPQDPFRYGKFRFTVIGAALVAAYRLAKENIYVGLFAAWAGIYWALQDFPVSGASDILAIFACLFCALFICEAWSVEKVGNFVSGLALMESIYGISQTLGFDPFLKIISPANMDFTGKPLGTFGQPTLFAAFVGLGVLYYVGSKKWVRGAVCAIALFADRSTCANLALLSGAMYLLFRIHPKYALIASSLSFAALVAWFCLRPTGGALDLDGRLFIWPKALAFWAERPLLGWGPGGWLANYDSLHIPGDRWKYVHMEWLQAGVEYGLVGFGGIVIGFFHSLFSSQRAPIWIGAWLVFLGVECAGNFIMHIATFGLVGAFVLISTGGYRHGLVRIRQTVRECAI